MILVDVVDRIRHSELSLIVILSVLLSIIVSGKLLPINVTVWPPNGFRLLGSNELIVRGTVINSSVAVSIMPIGPTTTGYHDPATVLAVHIIVYGSGYKMLVHGSFEKVTDLRLLGKSYPIMVSVFSVSVKLSICEVLAM